MVKYQIGKRPLPKPEIEYFIDICMRHTARDVYEHSFMLSHTLLLKNSIIKNLVLLCCTMYISDDFSELPNNSSRPREKVYNYIYHLVKA